MPYTSRADNLPDVWLSGCDASIPKLFEAISCAGVQIEQETEIMIVNTRLSAVDSNFDGIRASPATTMFRFIRF